MDGVEAVGVVPDEVLLLCGRPSSAPSAWWSPALAELPDDAVGRLRDAAARMLDEAGARDGATGALTGPLGAVAAVVEAATVVLLVETERADEHERRSVVVAPDRALLDLQEPTTGFHDLLLADPAAASVLLCGLLADGLAAPTSRVQQLAGRRSIDEVLAVLPEPARRSTTRVVRSEHGPADAVAHSVTVIHHDDGSVACWALPDGDLAVVPLSDDDTVVDLALVLLGAEDVEVAA